MNFDLTEEQRAIRDAFARFVDKRVVPQAAAIDEAHAFPHALFGELAGSACSACATPRTRAAAAPG